MTTQHKILSIFVHLILLLTVIATLLMFRIWHEMTYFYYYYEPNTFEHARLLWGRSYNCFTAVFEPAPVFDSVAISSSLAQSIKDGRFLKRYAIISVASDSTELIPLLKFSDVFAEKEIQYKWRNSTFFENKENYLINLCFDENNDYFTDINRGRYCGEYVQLPEVCVMGGRLNSLTCEMSGGNEAKDTINLVFHSNLWPSIKSYVTLVADSDFDPEQYIKESE